MDVERALLSSALTKGAVATLLARGIEVRHFSATPSGEECSEVFSWAIEHARKYNVSPSPALLKQRWPNWRAEASSDPVDALIDTFLAHVKRRAFSSKVRELASIESDPSQWGRLDEAMLDAARDLSALVPSGHVSRFSEMEQRIAEYQAEKMTEQHVGIGMGIPAFDEVTNGIQRGDLVTVAGYSGLGKSLLSQWWLMGALEQGVNGLLMSLEMSHRQIFERLDTMVLNFSHKLLRRRELPEKDLALWQRVASQFKAAENDLIVIDRLMGCTIDRVYAEINRYKPDLTVVDYVQLMKSSRRSDKQWEMLVDATNDLKAIALATDSAIVMVSQDGRGSAEDGSTDRNMGGSVSVYQAADIYIGLHQSDDMYAQDQIEVRLLKNRSGERKRNAHLRWRPSHMEIGPLQEGSEYQEFKRS